MSYVPTINQGRPSSGRGPAKSNEDFGASRAVDDVHMRDALETHILNGDQDVRSRDAYDSNLSALRMSQKPSTRAINENPYNLWPDARSHGFRPITYEPDGSFEALAAAGKLRDQNGKKSFIGAGEHVENKKFYIPGYTGFTRGLQHVSGRTYGEATRRALDTDYRENVCTSPIPSSPQNNRKVEHVQPPDTFISNTFAGKEYHVPGYTGFVPGVRQIFSRTYGSATSQELYTHALQHPRARAKEVDGFASSMRPRQQLVIDSAPLPGATRPSKRPEKLIPSHLQHLKFFPM